VLILLSNLNMVLSRSHPLLTLQRYLLLVRLYKQYFIVLCAGGLCHPVFYLMRKKYLGGERQLAKRL